MLVSDVSLLLVTVLLLLCQPLLQVHHRLRIIPDHSVSHQDVRLLLGEFSKVIPLVLTGLRHFEFEEAFVELVLLLVVLLVVVFVNGGVGEVSVDYVLGRVGLQSVVQVLGVSESLLAGDSHLLVQAHASLLFSPLVLLLLHLHLLNALYILVFVLVVELVDLLGRERFVLPPEGVVERMVFLPDSFSFLHNSNDY